MKKNILIFILIALLLCIISLFFIYQDKNIFNVRINAEFDNISSVEIDSNFAKVIKDELILIPEIKKIVIFSKNNNCNIYLKIKSFILNKEQIISKIERKINSTQNKTLKPKELYIDDEYQKKYQVFLIIYNKKLNEDDFDDTCKEIKNEIAAKKITSKILRLNERKKAIYINFKDDVLLNYNIRLSDIKNIIKSYNIVQNTTSKNNEKNSYPTSANGNIENITDIKNILIPFKNKSYSTKFYEIFDIEEKEKNPPDYCINFDDKKAQILALSKKSYYPYFLFQFKIKKFAKNTDDYTVKFLNTSKMKKIEIYLDNKSSIYNTINLYKKIANLINKNQEIIYFIGTDIPKISNNEIYFENEKNKLTILADKNKTKKIEKLLKENNIQYQTKNSTKIKIKASNLKELERKIKKANEIIADNRNILSKFQLYTSKTIDINYFIDTYSLIDIKANKENIINAIFAANEGLICDYFYENSKKIPIILKNKNDIARIFILNKNTKILTPLNSVAKSSIEEKYSEITRENNDFFSVLNITFKHKNPLEKFFLIKKIEKI